MKMYGVITGDIVDSTKINTKYRNNLIKAIERVVADANKYVEGNRIKLEIFRGDSFQLLVPNAKKSLRVAILLRLGLKKIGIVKGEKNMSCDARVSVGVGTIDYKKNNISTSDGEAYHNSGRAFDSLKKSSQLIIRTSWTNLNEEFDVECMLADIIIKRLTIKQAEITYLYLLKEINQKQIADELGIKPQNVNKLLSYGGNPIEGFIKRYEKLIAEHELY